MAAKIEEKESCAHQCRFYVQKVAFAKHNKGDCNRFPTSIPVNDATQKWCGEYQKGEQRVIGDPSQKTISHESPEAK
jgi:predicted dinucleotide-utilizing enzyme